MMKNLFFIFSFFSFGTTAFAQTNGNPISGFWYSADSSRVYKIDSTNDGYNAYVFSTKRPGDEKGKMVLEDVLFYPGKDDYEGLMYSSNGLERTGAKIKMEENNKLLLLKLPRLLIFPVYIKWYKK